MKRALSILVFAVLILINYLQTGDFDLENILNQITKKEVDISQLKAKDSVRVCTQNLNNYGLVKYTIKRGNKNQKDLDQQKRVLAKRFKENRCDVIAVQELIAKNQSEALEAAEQISSELTLISGKNYLAVAGKANDPFAKLGYLYNADVFSLTFSRSYSDYPLPRLSNYERNRYFSRGPLRVDLVNKNNSKLSLFNFHFKSASKYGGYDKTGHRFEYDRMQMAQALKSILLEVEKSNPDNIIVALGDRNSVANSASGRILTGNLELNFFEKNLCQLSKNNTAYCPDHLDYPEDYIDLIYDDPDIKLQSSLAKSHNEKNPIDEILIDKKNITKVLAANKKDDYNVGKVKADKKASDHALYWVDVKL